jgi:Putative beta-barrel porin 2
MSKRRVLICIFLFFSLASLCFGQTENKIRSAIEGMEASHPYRLSVFHIQPRLLVDSGYTSNAFYSSIEEISDYYASLAPGGGFAVNIGRRGYIELSEDVNFLYYRKLDQLRDIQTFSGVRFVTGSRKILAELGAQFADQKAAINSEFDIPADQKNFTSDGNFTIGVRSTTDVILGANYSKNRYEAIEGIPDPIVPPADNRALNYTFGIVQEFSEWLSLNADVVTGTTTFEDSETGLSGEQNESKTFTFLAGPTITLKRIAGSAAAGFNRIKRATTDEPLKDFIIQADMDFLLRNNIHLGFHAVRERRISAFLTNDFSLHFEIGGSIEMPIFRKLFFEGGYSYESNDYNDQAVSQGEVITSDVSKKINGVLKYKLVGDVYLHGGLGKELRQSNVEVLDKDRLLYLFGVTYDPFAED